MRVHGRLKGSRDIRDVGIASRLSADVIASAYDRSLPEFARGELLDLGCGNVPLYSTYRDLVSSVICVDWANTQHRNEFVDYECDLTSPLPFADSRFDTVILSDVLEHIPTPSLLLEEIERVLAPSGKLIMNVPFFYWLHEEPHDYYRFTSHALRRLAADAHLTILSLEPTGGTPEIVADLLAKHLAFLPFVGKSLAAVVQWATLRFVSTKTGARISHATAKRFPFGYFLVCAKS